jgi:hypothetical protein
MCNGPHAPAWKSALALAGASPRCAAKRRSDGGACQQPAMHNGRCRLHGGKSTGPRTVEGLERSRKARLTHGHYTAAAKAERRESRAQIRALKMLLRELGA